MVAAYIAAGNSAATALADLALAAAVTMQTGTPAAPLGITRPTDDPQRLDRAVPTLMADTSATMARWQRLAEAEIKEAATRAYSEAAKRSPRWPRLGRRSPHAHTQRLHL